MSLSRRTVWFVLLGMGAGFFVIQPFAVLVYNLTPGAELAFQKLSFWKRLIQMSLSPTSIFMGLAFAALGGLTGYSFGSWFYHKERLVAQRIESEKHRAALETMHELMVTLAHYIRNANVVIGSFSLRLVRQITEAHHREELRFIHQASQEIEAVIESLQNLTDLRTTPYTQGGTARMLDLKQDLEQRLAAIKSRQESGRQ